MTQNSKFLATMLVAISTLVLIGTSAMAETIQDQIKPTDAATGATAGKKKKSTEMSFEDVLVQGKYHFSDESVTTVEDDKVLDALLGVRTDFKDRIKKSTARH